MSYPYYSRRSITDVSTSNGLSRSRYFRPRFPRNRNRLPWYSHPRTRPSISDRDRRFLDWLRKMLKERERIRNGSDSESDDEEPDQPEVPEPERSRKLHVKNVDLHISENTKKHNTYMYDCTDTDQQDAQLVVRRGQPFLITIRFDRPYDIKKNDITLVFSLSAGENSKALKRTIQVNENRSASRNPRQWYANVTKRDSNSLQLEVFCPASTQIGEWELTIKTIVDVVGDKDLIWQYKHNDEICIIFNPWCNDDVVYLPDQNWLNEAVLNDDGTVYMGNYEQIGEKAWYYGQFDKDVLAASLHLVRRGFDFQAKKAMGNAAKVARVLAKIVNSNDDDGLLVGNWSDNYAGGVSPTSWSGSVRILSQYMRTGKPVKYGQCWVYSHVLTTVCRAIGLPCRSVTNFSSAHNTDDHLSIDTYYKTNASGKIVQWKSGDSVWNFHVWNEVWMNRPDLDQGYSGWQIIDATPQELSAGVFTCGPAPQKAIKEGQINVGEDTAFVFAEVNGDKVIWMKQRTGVIEKIHVDPKVIGKNISTHQPTGRTPGTNERLDITNDYKYPEGSSREREIVERAERMFRMDNLPEGPEEPPLPEPVKLSIITKDGVFVGSGFSVDVEAENKNDSPRTLDLTITVRYSTYFGEDTGKAIDTFFDNELLDPREKRTFTLNVPYEVASARPRENFNFAIKAVGEVKETNNVVIKDSTFRLRKPDIQTEGTKTVRRREEFDVEISFTNPLPKVLTNCEITVEGSLTPVNASDVKFRINPILAMDTWSRVIRLKSGLGHQRMKTANFGLSCDQLEDISGKHVVNISN